MNIKATTWKAVIIAALVMTVLWVLWEQPQDKNNTVKENSVFKVTVLEVVPGESSIDIDSVGVTKARWRVDIIANVSGRVLQLPHHTEPGNLLAQNKLLAKIQDTAYASEFKSAKARVEQARLELARYKHEQYVASKVGGGKKLSSFGRFEPHVAAAEAEVQATLAAEQFALQQWQDTKIKAPFDAVVLDKVVTPGQWVNSGDRLFTLAASHELDIKVELSATDWKRISWQLESEQTNKNTLATNAQVHTPEGEEWTATLRYLSPTMDATTRQRSLVLRVEEPYQTNLPLLPDQQVRVVFYGQSQTNVVDAPASVLTEDGKVWSLTDGKLIQEEVEILQEKPDAIKYRYLHSSSEPRQLVRFPLSTMLDGQRAIAASND